MRILENFREHERDELDRLEPVLSRFDTENSEQILDNLWGSLSFIRMVGEVADIYLSKVLDVFLDASTGRDNPTMPVSYAEISKNRPPSDGSPSEPPAGKEGPEEYPIE